MSILRGDFAPDQVAAIEDAMERTGLPFASAVRMLIDYGINARSGYRIATESLPGETSKEEGEGETPESQDPIVMEIEREGSGENGESVSVPDSPEQVRARARALRTRTRTQPVPIPEPPPEIDSPGLRDFLPDFATYRKLKKSPLTPAGWNLLFNRLKPAGKDHAVLALRYSISNGWKSFDVEWLKGKSWEQVASELGLSLRKEAARIDPEAIARADRKAARDRAEDAYRSAAHNLVFYPGSTDNWTSPSSCWLYDGLDALQEPSEFEARLTHARALIERLRALGAFPLVKAPAGTSPGLIFPACGGGPWRPSLIGGEGWALDVGQNVGSKLAALQAAHKLTIIDDPVSPNLAAHSALGPDELRAEWPIYAAFDKLAACPCGSAFPSHLADIGLTSHVCLCNRRYRIETGAFIQDGEEFNPFAHITDAGERGDRGEP